MARIRIVAVLKVREWHLRSMILKPCFLNLFGRNRWSVGSCCSLGISITLFLLLVELSLLLSGGVLVLLVFRHQVVHVGLGLSELHLIHALTSVPVEEGLAAEHGGELLRDALEQLLDGSGVAHKGGRHLQTSWWDVAYSGFDVVGDPFNEVAAVLVLDIEHLLINLLHGHAATEHGSHSQVAAVAGVTGSHHVLGIKHLLGQLGHSQGTVLLAASGCQGSKARHEEVETGEGHHVDSQLPQVSVQLAREAQAGGDTRHGGRHQMVEITIGRSGQPQGTEADIVQGLIVNAVGLVSVLNQLMDRQGGIVGPHHGVRHLW